MPKKQKRIIRKMNVEDTHPTDEISDDDEYVEEIEEQSPTRPQEIKRTNMFNVIIIILLVLLVIIGIVFLIRFFTLDKIKIEHSGIPSQNGDEGFEVIGTATVPAIPDIAVVNFSVQNQADNIRDVQEQNSTIAAKVAEELRKEGVSQDDIKIISYSINPRYRFDDNGNRILDGFEAVQRFEIKIRAINNTGEVLSSLINNGTSEISELRFTLDNIDKVEDEALIKAISDARVLAETSVAATGHGLGRIITINEVNDNDPTVFRGSALSELGISDSASVPEIYTGKQEIKKTVRVRFALN